MNNFKDYSILYVEDDEGVKIINSRFLNRIFKHLYLANDGEEAYLLYKKHNPDIILTDINMPKLDGLSLAKKIRKNDQNIKIIISSAFSDKKYLLDAIELKLEKYLIKPLSSRNLLPALNQAVQSLKKEKDIIITLNKDFYFEVNTSQFYVKNKVLKLTKKELLFLKLLVLNKNRIISYEEIEQKIWDNEYMSIDSLRTTIGFLRKKIPFNCIKNISNMGYKLNLET